MKRLYLFDGYNVINKIPELKLFFPKELQRAREALIDYIASHRDRLGLGYEIKIAFDARKVSNEFLRQQTVKGISLRFAESGQDADELIISEVRQKHQDHNITVITDDNRVGNNIRVYNAAWLKVIQYVALVNKSKKQSGRVQSQGQFKVDSIDGGDITAELKKFWLK